MGMWRMTPGYAAWVFGGLAVIVGTLVALGLANPSGQGLIYVSIGLLAPWLAGIFWFQSRAVDRVEQEMSAATTSAAGPRSAPADNPPADWKDLMRELAVKSADTGEQREATQGMTGMVRGQIRYGAVLCFFILLGMGLYYSGVGGELRPFGETGPAFPVALMPVFLLIIYGVARIPFNIAAARASGDAYLAPLGLEITQIPDVGVRPRYGGSGMQTDVSGPTVMAGRRHGRPVEIRIAARESETRVRADTPAFTVTGEDERLTAGDQAPDGVRAAVAEIKRDRRWKRVEVSGGKDGVVVSRRFRGSQHTQWLWMADLWLAERLAAAARAPRASE